MVVTKRSISFHSMNPSMTARKLATKAAVCTTMLAGEPTQRVIARAVFSMCRRGGMRRVYSFNCYTMQMQTKIVGNAHLIAGGSAAIAPLLVLLKKEGIEVHGNPDLYVREYKSFGVDDARDVRERSALRPTKGQRRIFILSASSMTAE